MSNAGLTQSNIAGDRQNQDPLFVEYEWKPSFIIKVAHRTPLKIVPPSCCLLYHSSYNNRNGHIKQGKTLSQRRKCIFFQYLCNSNQPHFPAVFSPVLAIRHIGSADRDPQPTESGPARQVLVRRPVRLCTAQRSFCPGIMPFLLFFVAIA